MSVCGEPIQFQTVPLRVVIAAHRVIAQDSSYITVRSAHLNAGGKALDRRSGSFLSVLIFSNIPSRASPTSLARNEVEKCRQRETRSHDTNSSLAQYTLPSTATDLGGLCLSSHFRR